MTSRQRVLDALARHNTGAPPVDLGGTESSGLTVGAHRGLRRHLGMPLEPPRVMEVMQMVVLLEDDLLERFGIDTVCLIPQPVHWRPFTMPDGSPCLVPEGFAPVEHDDGFVVHGGDGEAVARMPSGGFYFEPVNPPLADLDGPRELDNHLDTIHRFDWPSFCDESLTTFTRRACALHASGRAVVANLQCHLLAAGQILRGFERFMMDLVLDPILAEALLERLLEGYLGRCRRVLEAAGPHIDVVLLNDDLGTQAGPMLSPELYRRLVKPRQARLVDLVKRTFGKPVLFHSCGSVRAFLGDLVDIGIDAINPVQVSAAGMEAEMLVEQFGRHVSFWGGCCDTQRVLPRQSPEQVREHVQRQVDTLNRHGGLVCTQVHNVQPDVQPENVQAMLESFTSGANRP